MARLLVASLWVVLVLVSVEAETSSKYGSLGAFLLGHMNNGTLSIVSSGACTQPKEIGPCKAAFQRWYFNTRWGRCVRFNWGGCNANENNFTSKKKCMKTCVKSNKKRCDEPIKAGPCKAAFQRYYYDAVQKTCTTFRWGGCRANGNNFANLKQCQKTCEK